MKRALASIAVLAALLAGAGDARAYRVEVLPGARLVISGLPGETNRLTVTAVTAGEAPRVEIVDATAPQVSENDSATCHVAQSNTVVCSGRFTAITVLANDGDDEVTVHGQATTVDGGGGNDRVVGSDNDDDLAGGPGNDTLIGRGGRDILRADGGADVVDAQDGGPDWIACDTAADKDLRLDAVDDRSACPVPATQPAPPPPPLPPAPPPPPPEGTPIATRTSVVRPERGVVLIRRPGSRTFVRLTAGALVPMGSEIDARNGTVEIVVADGRGGFASARAWEGRFILRQSGAPTFLPRLTLSQPLTGCTTAARSRGADAARRRSRTRSRRLWVRTAGRFKTQGRYAATTVRGTEWFSRDRCTSSFVRVTQGSVFVRDFITRRIVVVAAPGTYRARRVRVCCAPPRR